MNSFEKMENPFEDLSPGSQLYGPDAAGAELNCPDCKTSFHANLEAVIPDHDDYNGKSIGWEGRGEVIGLALECEGCEKKNSYRLLIGNHKGTFAFVLVKRKSLVG